MLDLPHVIIESTIQEMCAPTCKNNFNPNFLWIHPLQKHDELTALALAENKIQELSRMQENWDGYGSLRVSGATEFNSLESLRGILQSAPIPDIAPNPNGTLSFEWKTKHGFAQMEIGQTKMSFYLKPTVGESIFINANTSDILFVSIKIGILIGANLFLLRLSTMPITKISMNANVSAAY